LNVGWAEKAKSFQKEALRFHMKIPRRRLISLQKKSQANAAILVIAEQSVNASKLLDTDYIYIIYV